MSQICNPFLPLDEYVPDGEPHVFGDRVYLYGSHDKEGGSTFCMLDYVVYSAPVSDLTDWRFEGVSYSAKQDPLYGKERRYLYAPDVVQGNDGRYYLYYCMAGDTPAAGYQNPVSVAVSDSPAGKFKYLGVVRTADGTPYTEHFMFDPAVINDGGVIRLYSGTRFSFHEMELSDGQRESVTEWLREMFGKSDLTLESVSDCYGAYTCTLADDMLTMTSDMVCITPKYSKGTSWEGHPFFEASSIRKIGGMYYFVYSSALSHELCYAVSSEPDRGFVCKGTIVSNGDIGYQGRQDADKVAMTGNNHGGIECIGGRWYVFYHRHTHASSYSRQACAEPIEILPDGTIPQVLISSCGLNGGPLRAEDEYPAPIACVLTNGSMPMAGLEKCREKIPQITHQANERFIAHIMDRTTVGFRSFLFTRDVMVCLIVSGTFQGEVVLSDDDGEICTARIDVDDFVRQRVRIPVAGLRGEHAIYFTFRGKGCVDLYRLIFSDSKTGNQ